jgi:hypothetical protein
MMMTMAGASLHTDGPIVMFDRGRWWVRLGQLATMPAELLSPFPYGVGIVAVFVTTGMNSGRSGSLIDIPAASPLFSERLSPAHGPVPVDSR